MANTYDKPGNEPELDRKQLDEIEKSGGNPNSSSTTGGAANFSSGGERSLYNPSSNSATSSNTASPAGSFYNSSPTAPGKLSFGNYIRDRRKMAIAGIIAGAIGGGFFFFLALAPLKILHIVNNLQSHYFSSSEDAVQKETDALFSTYARKYIMPGLNTCRGSTIDRSCTPSSIKGNSVVSQLFQGWKTARLENTLAEKHGLEFKKVGTHFYMKMPGMTGDGANIDSFVHPDQGQLFSLDDYIDKSSDPQFKKVGRAELRQNYRAALANETRWKQVMYRYKVGGHLERKYGLKRCIVACTKRDNFNDWKDNKTRAAKMILAERVLLPRSETLALVIQCVLDDSCKPQDQSETDDTGRKQSKTQIEMQEKLASLAATNTGKYADVLAHSDGILKNGYKRYVTKLAVKAIVGKAGGTITDESAEKIGSTYIPVIGWINTVSSTIGTLDGAKTKIKTLSYMTNAAAMVSTYTTYRVYADEVKTGNVDSAIVGSFNDSLGPGDKNSTGGMAEAEQTPLYAQLIGDGSSNPSTTLNTLLGGSVYAASSPPYICKDNKPVPAGQSVCKEEVLGGTASAVNIIDKSVKELGPLVDLAEYWNSSVGRVIKLAAQAGAYILNPIFKPILGPLSDRIANAAEPLVSAFTENIIPSPFSDNMGGGRTFDMMAGGADVSGNDYAQNGLGGMKLTAQQSAAIINEQAGQEFQDFKNQSLLAQTLDTNSKYSLASKLIMSAPNSWSSASQSVASIFTNPLGKLSHSFASLFSPNYAFAAAAQPDAFGVDQYGYPANDANLTAANADQEQYWMDNCSTDGKTLDWTKPVNKNWQDSETPSNDTGMPENTSTNPCLLIEAALGSAGGIYDPSLLGADEFGGDTSGGSSSNSNPGVYKNPLRDIKNLTVHRLDQGIDYAGSGPVYALGNGKVLNTLNCGWGSCGGLGGAGAFIVYQLSDGPARGKFVYFAENCVPKVNIGDSVTTDTVICDMIDQSPHVETGWANGAALGEALAHDVYSEGHATEYGRNFSDLMHRLGNPPGTYDYPQEEGHELGSLPAGWPTW